MNSDVLKNEYWNNEKFRIYVRRYCKGMNVTILEALTHEIVRQVYLSYTEV